MAPLRLCDSNPRYLEFRGSPVLLITSGEHYGAVLNRDFDYVRYLDELSACGFNLTRTFSGTYLEIEGAFGIVGNTLAPAPGRFLCPWARSPARGCPGGGNRFDLSQPDDAYFARLKDFLAQAARRGIVVELVLFSFLYNDDLWAVSPMNAACNLNGVGDLPHRHRAFSLDSGPLLAVQENLVRRIVTECNAFDNLYYEIINEPYSLHDGTAFLDWQNRIVDVIVETEQALPNRHLIAANVQNRTMRVRDLHPRVSIINFHYADPSAVGDNYHLDRVIADDETGFKGQDACPYRMEAWKFLLSGGGIFSHLDYSFTVKHPAGTAPIEQESPGFGGPQWRAQLMVLKQFMEQLPFPAMSPHQAVLNSFGSQVSAAATVHVLADPGRVYAAYVCGGGHAARLAMGLPPGNYRAEWIRPTDGHLVRRELFAHEGGNRLLATPLFAEDIALRIWAD